MPTSAMDYQVASIFEHPSFAAFVNHYHPFEYLPPFETVVHFQPEFLPYESFLPTSQPFLEIEEVLSTPPTSPPASPPVAVHQHGRKPVIIKKTMQNRVIWTKRLHSIFLEAIKHVGINAKPKLILQVMAVEGLTRENVASHLQKYRKKLNDRKHEADSEDEENEEEFNTNHQIDLSILSSSKQNKFQQLLADFRVVVAPWIEQLNNFIVESRIITQRILGLKRNVIISLV